MAHIENLSNELFYEIFEYLHGWEIYNAFSNLNTRLHNVLIYSSQPIMIDLCKELQPMFSPYCKQMIIPKKNRIISLRFSYLPTMNKFFGLFSIDSTFTGLKSLILNEMNFLNSHFILKKAASLPHLFSLTVSFGGRCSPDLAVLYRWILRLPVLKYCKISLEASYGTSSTLPSTINGVISSIEHLIINHRFTIDNLLHILSYTPKLCHLDCKFIEMSIRNIGNVPIIHLPNLRYISLNDFTGDFNKYEMFFQRIQSPIEILRFKTSHVMNYVDANRWERIISQDIPNLQRFYFQGSVICYDTFSYIQAHQMSNGFTSLFWTKRQWIFQLKVDVNRDRRMVIEMTYIIYPHR